MKVGTGWRLPCVQKKNERILSSRVRTFENRVNKLEVELEGLRNKTDNKNLQKGKEKENIECKEETITMKDNKVSKIIQLKDSITNFGTAPAQIPRRDGLSFTLPVSACVRGARNIPLLQGAERACA